MYNLRERTRLLLTFLSISAIALVLLLFSTTPLKKSPKSTTDMVNIPHLHIHNHKHIQVAHSTCQGTLYPELCVSTLSSFPDLASQSLPQIISATVNHTLSKVRVSSSNCTSIRKKLKNLDPLQKGALDDCLELFDDTMAQLKTTISDLSSKKLASKHHNDLQTLLSAAMTNQYTCLDGFARSKADVREEIKNNLYNISQLMSNSLAILKKIPGFNTSKSLEFHEFGNMKNGFPSWVSRKDRKLLQTTVNTIKYDLRVAKDGTGNFTTIGEAVAAAPNSSTTRFVIYIKAGAYFENVEVERKKPNLMFVGDGIGKTIVKASRNVIDGWTTFKSATVAVVGDGFIAKGITIENSAGPSKHQAVALRSGSDFSAFYQCSFVGYQDTLYVHSLRQFYRECDIYGTVDKKKTHTHTHTHPLRDRTQRHTEREREREINMLKIWDSTMLFQCSWEEIWRENRHGGCWFTLIALSLILVWHCSKTFSFRFSSPSNPNTATATATTTTTTNTAISGSTKIHSQFRISEIVSDADLKFLSEKLDQKLNESEKWEQVIDKRNNLLSYNAKCCKPKDGPLKYLSVTVFENCSPEMLKNFYMDNDYRKQWDKTVVEHEQLQVDKINGVEIGRTIKKFPLLTPREYVLAWRLWEGKDKTFYCFLKECEHPSVPRQKKFVRVRFFRSGWQIRKVPGRNACEIKMFHQEDAGLNVEMAKLAFAKGIWSYVCKMDSALRKYSGISHPQSSSAVTLIQKVPPGLDTMNSATSSETTSATAFCGQSGEAKERKISKRPSRKLLANGLLLLGGAICLSRGHSSLGAKVAMAYILTKLSKHGASSDQSSQS